MQSETVASSITPVADTWYTIGTMNVPAGVKRLVKAKFGITPDPAAAVISRFVPVFRLMGSGLSEQSPHEFVGMSGGVTNIAANGGALSLENIVYECDIPVMTGGQYLIQFNMIDEGAVPLTAKAEMTYDNGEVVRKNSMSQYVDSAQATAADAWQAVGTITIPQLKSGDNPSKIREVVMAHGLDMANAGTLRGSIRIRLSGSGIAESGSHEFIGANQGSNVTAAATDVFDKGTVRAPCDIPVNPGGSVLVEQLVDSELPTAGSVAVGLVYE